MSLQSRVITCERTGLWAARLRPLLPPGFALRQTRLLADLTEELSQAPASLLVIEVRGGNFSELLERTVDWSRRYPRSAWAAVAARADAEFETIVREAGAVHFETSPRLAANIASLAVAHAARHPQPKLSLTARLWESLPWLDAAAG